MRLNRYKLCACLCVVSLAQLAAAEPAPAFTLGKYVPENVWLVAHSVSNPERAWVDQRISEIIEAAAGTGVHREALELVLSVMPAGDREQTRLAVNRLLELSQQVRWLEICQGEVVFAERFQPDGFGAEYLMLTRPKAESVAGNFDGLSAILKELSTKSGCLDYVEASAKGVQVHSLRVRSNTSELSVPFVSVVRKGDILGIVVMAAEPSAKSGPMLREVRSLLAGDADARSIAASERFQKALKEVAAPRDALVYFDARGLVGSMQGTFKTYQQRAAGDSDEAAGFTMIAKLVEALDLIDYSITTESTVGFRCRTETATRIIAGKETSPLVRALVDRKPFEKFDAFVPADATGFTLDGFVDLKRLYDWAIAFIAQNVPSGAAVVAKWNAVLASVGFEPERDLFSWFSGELAAIEMPPSVITPMGGSDSVWMVRVKNDEVARTKVNAAIDFMNAKLQAQGQTLMISPAQVAAEGFREVTHPMMAMFLRPVIGVKDGWLIVGSSAKAVDKCLAVAAGKAPSVATNERFKREGLVPDGPVHGVSFADISKTGQELGQAVAMVGAMGGMLTAGMPPETPPEARKLVQGMLSLVSKLAPVLQRIDFYSSKASISRYDGKGAFRCETVTTYKAPAKEAPVAATPPQEPQAPRTPPTPAAPPR